MRISDNALNVIMSVLNGEAGFDNTGYEVREAIENLCKTRPNVNGSIDLQPGEMVWVLEGYENDCDSVKVGEHRTLDDARRFISDAVEESKQDRSYSHSRNDPLTADDFNVLIVRRTIDLEVESEIKVTFK